MPIPVFTIASNNYLALARVFAESYRRHHPGAEVWVALADRRDPRVDYEAFPFRVVFAEELGIPAFPSFAFRYDILELNTAIKPWVFAFLRDRLGCDRALYFDPDILVADALPELEAALESHPAVLTPHLTRPLDNEHRPSERHIRMAGIYNLGFVGLRLDASTAGFLDWWQERLHRFCLVDPHHGLFVDQAWMDFAPAFLERVAVLRSSRFNVAYWNLAHRALERRGDSVTVDGEPLGFFHFSGVAVGELGSLSRHQDRVDLRRLPAVAALLDDYQRLALAAGHERLRELPYGFDRFRPDGPRIGKLLRRTLLRTDPHGRRFADPFDRTDSDGFFTWLGEPLDFAAGRLTRAALALWESRPELVARFPELAHRDLPAFVAWLEGEGRATAAELPAELLAAVEVRDAATARVVPYQQEPFRHFLHLARPERPEALEAIDLAHPGGWLPWLVEPFPGGGPERPWLCRLGMLLWEKHGALQRAFPDPLGRDLDELALVVARRGSDLFGLAPELAAELERRLPVALAERRPRAIDLEASPAAVAPPAAAEAAAPPRRSRPARFGVQVLFAARTEPAAARLARATLAALAEIGLPHAGIDLDLDWLGQSVDGLFAPADGAPWPVTITHLDLRLSPWRFGWLPAPTTQGGRRIGYLDWGFAELPARYRERLTQWDEIWVPSRFAQALLGAGSRVPVRWVPPALLDTPRSAAAPAPAARNRWLARFRADDRLQLDDPWTLLAALRHLRRSRPDLDWSLDLHVEGLEGSGNPASEAAETLAALAAEAADLPVRLCADGEAEGEADDFSAALAGADALLVSSRSGALEPGTLEAAARGLVLVAPAQGALADLLDATTGYPLPLRAARLGRSLGPLPGSAAVPEVDSEGAAAVLAELADHPEEAARRAAHASERARELYGSAAAARRLLVELDRLREELGAG